MCKLKQKLMAGIVAGTVVFGVTPGMAGSAWTGIAINSLVSIGGDLLSYLGANKVIWMAPAGNLDPIQLAEEVGVLTMMKKVKYEWKPKPQKEYQEAAGANGGGSGGGGGDINGSDSLTKTLGFQAASLYNVGIEAIGVGPALSEIISDSTREDILSKLEPFQTSTGRASSSSSSSSSSGNQNPPGAGSCEAPYTICEEEVTTEQQTELNLRQEQNKQWFATAGIAHAELGMKSVYQAMINDGGLLAGSAAAQEEIRAAMADGKNSIKVQDLSGLIGIAVNTVMAQKIVALMNLELAQRLNQGNMLQGSILTIEAAKALRKTGDLQH